jgi:hypothetical protein
MYEHSNNNILSWLSVCPCAEEPQARSACSLWKKWCTEEDVVWSKVGKGAPRQTNDKTSNGLHTFFFVPGLGYPFFLWSPLYIFPLKMYGYILESRVVGEPNAESRVVGEPIIACRNGFQFLLLYRWKRFSVSGEVGRERQKRFSVSVVVQTETVFSFRRVQQRTEETVFSFRTIFRKYCSWGVEPKKSSFEYKPIGPAARESVQGHLLYHL